ncbi:MAG: site-2 protease family protein, partial [Coriobacteriia bacterium]|nr:site-2 protease family protein [Coriobacteriia bacterium]
MQPFANMPTGIEAIFWGVITFSILVILHEGGHFFAARIFGVKVHEFMLGLPGPALRWRSKKSGITYGVTAVPLGGYVRIAGMEPGREDEMLGGALALLADRHRVDADALADALGITRERGQELIATMEDYGAAEPIVDWPETHSLVERGEGETDAELLARVRSTVYRGQAPWKRVIILAMGVIINLLTAVVVFTVVLSAYGYAVFSDKPIVGSVSVNSAAEKAGLVAGDSVTAIDGATITKWEQIPARVRAHRPGDTLEMTV